VLSRVNVILYKGPSIKDVRTKSRKIDSLPPCPHWPKPSCPCGYTINFKKSEVFCTKKCGRPHLKNPSLLVRKMSALDKLPSTADVFYERPLKLSKYCRFVKMLFLN